jgi:hypothetical protein
MANSFYGRAFEREQAEQEAYAAAHGYTITDRDEHTHYIDAVRHRGPLALCASRWDAIRIAYALAKTFPKAGAA